MKLAPTAIPQEGGERGEESLWDCEEDPSTKKKHGDLKHKEGTKVLVVLKEVEKKRYISEGNMIGKEKPEQRRGWGGTGQARVPNSPQKLGDSGHGLNGPSHSSDPMKSSTKGAQRQMMTLLNLLVLLIPTDQLSPSLNFFWVE